MLRVHFPDLRTRDELECEFLTKLMKLDAKIWSQRSRELCSLRGTLTRREREEATARRKRHNRLAARYGRPDGGGDGDQQKPGNA
jgi:hypothetical protein